MHCYLYIIIFVPHILNIKFNSDHYWFWIVLSFKHINKWQTSQNMTLLNKTEGIKIQFEGLHPYFKIRKEWRVLIHMSSGTGGPQMNTVYWLCCYFFY